MIRKTMVVIGIGLTIAVLMIGCVSQANASGKDMIAMHYYRVGAGEYFGTKTIRTTEELQQFVADHFSHSELTHGEDYGNKDSLSKRLQNYDQAYFKNNVLVVHGAVFESGSGFHYRIGKINIDSNGILDIKVERFSDGYGNYGIQYKVLIFEIKHMIQSFSTASVGIERI